MPIPPSFVESVPAPHCNTVLSTLLGAFPCYALRAHHPLPPRAGPRPEKSLSLLISSRTPPIPHRFATGVLCVTNTSRAFRPGEGGAPAGEGHSTSAGRIARSRQRVTRPHPHVMWDERDKTTGVPHGYGGGVSPSAEGCSFSIRIAGRGWGTRHERRVCWYQ